MARIALKQYKNTPSPYPKTHGIIQMPDGGLVVVNCIPPGECADEYYEMVRGLDEAHKEEADRVMASLRKIGLETERALRMRRVRNKKEE